MNQSAHPWLDATIEKLKEQERVRLLSVEYRLYEDRYIRAHFKNYDAVLKRHIAELTSKLDWKHKVKLKMQLDCHRLRVKINGAVHYLDFVLYDGQPEVMHRGQPIGNEAGWIVMEAMK
jgi:hypothetical protein